MPVLNINGADLYYDDTGQGAETIVFIHGLMLASESWGAQREAFRDRYRVITFDLRGQGRSTKTADRLDIDSLTEDSIALLERLGLVRVHLVGFSMGSFIALRIAARRRDLVRSLTLIGVSAEAEEPQNMPRYARLIGFVRWFGPRWIAPRLMKILFGDSFLAAPETAQVRDHWLRHLKALPRELYRAAAASASRPAVVDELPRITAPTLVVSGDEDRPISPQRAFAVHQRIVGSDFHSFPRTGHAVMIERPADFNRYLSAFLLKVGTAT